MCVWEVSWVSRMNRSIGKIVLVREVRHTGILLEDWFWYPFFVLAIPTQEELVLHMLSDG